MLKYSITYERGIRVILNALRGKGNREFSKRIKSRHHLFWSPPNAEIVRNTIMTANDPIEKWKDIEHWQRKLSNKFNAREFAKKHGCKIPVRYWQGRDVNTIKFRDLPVQFVVKPTIGYSCKNVFLIDNGVNLMDGKVYSNEDLTGILRNEIAKDTFLEFVFEEFVKTEQGEYKIPLDYKFFMFEEEIATIQVVNRSGPSKGFMSFYNVEWKRIKTVNNQYLEDCPQKRPLCLNEMIQYAKILSKAYEIFVRIDFYATDKGAVFGEFTPTPATGDYFTTYGDKLLAGYWKRIYRNKS